MPTDLQEWTNVHLFPDQMRLVWGWTRRPGEGEARPQKSRENSKASPERCILDDPGDFWCKVSSLRRRQVGDLRKPQTCLESI